MHISQSLPAISESKTIISTVENFNSSQDSRPMIGFKLDAMTSGYLLTFGKVNIPKWLWNDIMSLLDKTYVENKIKHIKSVLEWKNPEYKELMNNFDTTNETMIELNTKLEKENNEYNDIKIKYEKAKGKDIATLNKQLEKLKSSISLTTKALEQTKQSFSNEILNELLYTGHNLISVLLPDNFEYSIQNNISPDGLPVNIIRGVLLSGTLDKKAMGSSSGSLIHHLSKDYGNQRACTFVSDFSRMINKWLLQEGFSVGIYDCIAYDVELIEEEINKNLLKAQSDIQSEKDPDTLEMNIKIALNDTANMARSIAQKALKTDNKIKKIVDSGAKGSTFNILQITGIVGQQNVSGKRIEKQFGGRTLPHFEENIKDIRTEFASRGFVFNSYFKGMNPIETFFAAAGGREGLIDTAIKSVTADTTIIIIENGEAKYITIGEYIDTYLDDENNKDKVKHFDEANMEYLDLKENNTFISTCDEDGKVTWGEVVAITRHDPGTELYEVKTQSGREVIVTAAKSLIVWDDVKQKIVPKLMTEVKVNDYVPITMNLCKPPITIDYVDMNKYCPKTERQDHLIPDKFELNYENGVFIGLFLADGDVDTSSKSTVRITKNNVAVQDFVKAYFKKHNIHYHVETKVVEKTETSSGSTSTMIRGNCSVFAQFLLKFVGHTSYDKYIPNEAFTAPEEFIKGLIGGYFSGDGTVTKYSIDASSVSKKLIEGIITCCNRLGIFCKLRKSQKSENIAECYHINIRAQWATIFAKKIKLIENNKQQKLDEMTPSIEHRNYSFHNDIVFDPIVEINKLSVEKYPKMYDLTIPSTLNFSVASGLQLRDTATTGYLQRKLIKMLEDLTASYVGTINDTKQNVIQFNYGEDNLDASKLIDVGSKNDKVIYSFIDIKHVSQKLNTDYEWEHKNSTIQSKKRKLTQNEINYIRDEIIPSVFQEYYTINANEECIYNAFSYIADSFKIIELYEDKIDILYKEITKQLRYSMIQSGECVGSIAGTSMGEQNTQSSLNSVVGDTEILIMINNKCLQTTIGNLIDEECKKGFDTMKYLGQNDTNKEAYAEIVNIKNRNEEWKIQSINEDGKVEWRNITKLIRHPLYTKLIKVTTESGREVTATTGLSFLVKNEEGKIVPIEGYKLKIGDRIPFGMEKVYFEQVIKIEEMPTDNINYVYDFEVPDTGNFSLLNQMHVRDSFHSSGSFKKNLTFGVARLQELMNATKNPKFKSLTIFFDKTRIDTSKLSVIREFTNIYLLSRTLQDFISTYSIDYQPVLTPLEQVWYHLYQTFVSQDNISHCKYRLRLKINTDTMFLAKRTLIQIAQIIESLFIKNINFFVICSSDQLGIIDIWVEDTLSDPSFFFTAKGIEEDLLLDKFINNNNKMYHLIKKIILPKFTKLHISGIEDIKDCYYEETKSGEWHVQTKGGNLNCLLYNPFIDHETTTTNDMWEIHRLFGIEATKKWLKQEFSNVLKVSHRHLDILVDKMTYMGGISSVSHYGLDRKIIGPLSKATFERALVTLLTAAQKSELDQLKSVSSCVATGKLGRFGTGMVDLIIDNDAIINNPYAQKIYSSQDIENMIEDLPDFEAEEDEDMITIDEPIELNDEDIY